MKLLVFIFSLLSRFGSLVKNLAYELGVLNPRPAPLKVVSIGNIALGGTEKTPLAIELLLFLKDRGFRPALVTRGYRGTWERRGGVLSDGKRLMGSWEQSGDEPWMVATNIPQAGVFVGRDRLASCARAQEYGFDVAVLDDGFQHRRLARNLDIVLFNPGEKFSLREPFSALKRADIILVKRNLAVPRRLIRRADSLGRKIFRYSVTDRGFFSLDSKTGIQGESLLGKRVLAFSGIANPERFFCLLRTTGAEVVGTIVFPDHFTYPAAALERIKERVRIAKAEAAVTTEKDAIKLRSRPDSLGDAPVYYLKMGLDLDPEFYPSVLSRLGENHRRG